MNAVEQNSLKERMKKYESVSKCYLTTRVPVIIRIDGKAFRTFTKGFNKPYDEVFAKVMQKTMKYLCENIQNCVLGYTQSDEISLVLIDYQNTETWFGYNVQKMNSVSASMATMAFNNAFIDVLEEYSGFIYSEFATDEDERHFDFLCSVAEKRQAMFDARVFNIPKEEVCNYIYWRQLDAVRNSIQKTGLSYFSHKKLQNKSMNEIKTMLIKNCGFNWDTNPVMYKWGTCCVRRIDETTGKNKWFIDNNTPLFKDEERRYVNELVLF